MELQKLEGLARELIEDINNTAIRLEVNEFTLNTLLSQSKLVLPSGCILTVYGIHIEVDNSLDFNQLRLIYRDGKEEVIYLSREGK